MPTFKCLVVLEKGKIWEFIFWDRNIEFTILYKTCGYILSLPRMREFPLQKLGLWNRVFLEMDEYIEKNPPSNKCTTEKCHPMAIKLKDCKFLKKDSDLWETNRQTTHGIRFYAKGRYSGDDLLSRRNCLPYVPSFFFLFLTKISYSCQDPNYAILRETTTFNTLKGRIPLHSAQKAEVSSSLFSTLDKFHC